MGILGLTDPGSDESSGLSASRVNPKGTLRLAPRRQQAPDRITAGFIGIYAFPGSYLPIKMSDIYILMTLTATLITLLFKFQH